MGIQGFISLWKQTFKEYSEDKVARLAAALSYYTVFSIAPLLIIVIAVTGWVLGSQEDVRTAILSQIQGLIGSEAASSLINDMIAGSQNPATGIFATVIGIATLLFGATGFFIQLQEALNTIWEVQEEPGSGILGMLKDRFLSFTMILGIGFLLLVSLVISAFLSGAGEYITNLFPGSNIVLQIINNLISLGVITLLFGLMYKILPDAEVSWKDVWPGAFVTAALFTLGKWAIGLYLGTRGFSDTYGAAGALIIILLWVYYSSQILFIGAEFTQVYAKTYGKGIMPEEGALRIDEPASEQDGATRETGPASNNLAGPASSPGISYSTPYARRKESELLPQAQPSLVAFAGVIMALVGFLGGWVIRRNK